MNRIKILKGVVNLVVGTGVSKITHSILKNNVEPETVTDKVAVAAGTTVITGMAVNASKTYTDAKIDEYIASFKEYKEKKKIPDITTKK
jgi:hypothetical protein